MKIKLENLEKKLDGNVIIENVNMEFESGNIYGLVGRNGSGKTMIMKCLCGFMKSKGDIIIDGVKVDTSKKYLNSDGTIKTEKWCQIGKNSGGTSRFIWSLGINYSFSL